MALLKVYQEMQSTKPIPQKQRAAAPGVGVDSSGAPAVDPTTNVIALNEAANKRQDDLRVYSERLNEAKFDHLNEVAAVRESCRTELQAAETRRIDEQAALRAHYAEKLSIAESARIDAIRAVDVAAVAIASQRASDQANVLQTQVATSAEALRTLVASTAATVATSLQQMTTSLSTRITTLEQAQYVGQGRSALADPAFTELLAEVKGLRESRATGTGKSAGIGMTWAILVAGATIAIGLATAIIMERQPTVQPIVQYVPAPTATPTAPAPITVPR